ncbi:MAG TPA: hypothetical protein VM096_07225 [Vicinamibacterales bacterium]|nr:hypothetical protein [Vicinamibacterales bacterium]
MDAPDPSAKRQTASIWVIALAAFWMASAVGGLYITWAYENGPGPSSTAGPEWPLNTRLVPAGDRPTLVFLAHPQCTCTTASLGELAEALARAKQVPKTYVVFLKPSSMPDGWEKTELWHAAESLPNTTIVRDEDGREAERFGSVTSGQTLLYAANGSLLFNGGITGSRGHAGDNAGRASIVDLLNHAAPVATATKVFGCSLFASKKS